jgi:hypothetical protein
MPLLKPEFLRAHPVQSGMIWGAGFGALFLLAMWATRIIPITPVLIAILVLCSVAGGLSWGYSIKAYYDREGL